MFVLPGEQVSCNFSNHRFLSTDHGGSSITTLLAFHGACRSVWISLLWLPVVATKLCENCQVLKPELPLFILIFFSALCAGTALVTFYLVQEHFLSSMSIFYGRLEALDYDFKGFL